ncbi:MAG: hypothetical protein IJU29_07420 [Oscillospiraceae bacterium]|nr:hypothetical protein [Oscillospiraceae bacterium]
MNELTQAQVYEALGLTQDESEKGPEAADPAQAAQMPSAEGEKEREAAEPAADEKQQDTSEKPTAPQNGSEQHEQTPEERREFAARRRREEQQAAIQKAVDEALGQERERSKREWTDFFARAGLKNPMTDTPITSLEEFNAWKTAHDAAQLERELQEGKLTPESLNRLISGNPTVQRIEEALKAAQEAPTSSTGETTIDVQSKELQARIEAEIAEIHAMDPTINGVEDLLTAPKAEEFYEHVRHGASFVDAWYLTHREEVRARDAETARQQAQAKARSKDHLAGPGKAIGGGAADVPSDVLALYRELNPGVSDAEIARHYQRSHKG